MSNTLQSTPSKPNSVKLSGATKEVIRGHLREVILVLSEERELQKYLDLALDGLGGYCQHVPQEDVDRVKREAVKLLYFSRSTGWGPEQTTTALVELTDGFATIYNSEDTTGHGCQCAGDIGFYKTRDEAERLGLQESDRDAIADGKFFSEREY